MAITGLGNVKNIQDPFQRYTGSLGGQRSAPASFSSTVATGAQDIKGRATQSMQGASQSFGRMSQAQPGYEKSVGGGITAATAGFSSGLGLAAAGGASFTTAAGATTAATGAAAGGFSAAAMLSNPVGWVFGGLALAGYLFS